MSAMTHPVEAEAHAEHVDHGHSGHSGHSGHADHVAAFRRMFWIMLAL